MRGWRNFKGPVDMDLRRRVFLIGPNASGKSNILDAFRFLRDVAADGLDKAVAARGGVAQIRTLQATRPAGIELAVEVGTDSDKEVRAMVEEGGLSIGDALLPKAAPKGAHEFGF